MAQGKETSEPIRATESSVLRIVFAICRRIMKGRVYESFPYVAKQILK